MIVYKLINTLNSDFYIGKTVQNLNIRLKRHFSKSSNCVKLKNAIQKYGKENFSAVILGTYSNIKELNEAEIRFISDLKPNYNLTLGGDGGSTRLGQKHSADTKEKMSKAHIGEKNPNFSKTTSDKQKSVAAKLMIGNKHHKLGVSFWLKNRDLIMAGIKRRKIIDLTTGTTYLSVEEAASILGVSKSTLYVVLSGHRKSNKWKIAYI